MGKRIQRRMPAKSSSQRRKKYYGRKFAIKKGTIRNAKGDTFLKKSSSILRKGNRLEAYRFIKKNHKFFGLRWLLKRFSIYPNAYYNYLKNRKKNYYHRKEQIKKFILTEYHKLKGVPGYRTIHYYLRKANIKVSLATIHKYMNKELQIYSIVRRKYKYQKGIIHKTFENKLKQNFKADRKNQKWCTDFTYLNLTNGTKRYNCTIIDLYDRSVVASITDRNITSDLAIRTLKKALTSQQKIDVKDLILHSDQGSQYTSEEFTEFCKSAGITQSMSRAGCPYDNAPMERYYNTLKNELINLYHYHTEKELYMAVETFAYVFYNHKRPHSYNDYKTPFEARFAK